MKLEHFIVYSAILNNQVVIGNNVITIEGHIRNIEDIRRIEKEIESNNKMLSQVVITNWRRFE